MAKIKKNEKKMSIVRETEFIAIVVLILLIVFYLLLTTFHIDWGGNETRNQTNDTTSIGDITTSIRENRTTTTNVVTTTTGGSSSSTTTTSVYDPDHDSDGDGFPDEQEIHEGTDPNDPNDYPYCEPVTDCWGFCYGAGYINGGWGPVDSPGNCNANERYMSGCCCNMSTTPTTTTSTSTTTTVAVTTTTMGTGDYGCCYSKLGRVCQHGIVCPVTYRLIARYETQYACDRGCPFVHTTTTTPTTVGTTTTTVGTTTTATTTTTGTTTTVYPCNDSDTGMPGTQSLKIKGYCQTIPNSPIYDSCANGKLVEWSCGASNTCVSYDFNCLDWFAGGQCVSGACVERTCDATATETGYEKGAWFTAWETMPGSSDYVKCGNYAVLQCSNQGKSIGSWNTGCNFGKCCVWKCSQPTTIATTTTVPDCSADASQWDYQHYAWIGGSSCQPYASTQCSPYAAVSVSSSIGPSGCCYWVCTSETICRYAIYGPSGSLPGPTVPTEVLLGVSGHWYEYHKDECLSATTLRDYTCNRQETPGNDDYWYQDYNCVSLGYAGCKNEYIGNVGNVGYCGN